MSKYLSIDWRGLNDSQQTYELAGPFEPDECKEPYSELIESLEIALKSVRELKEHDHQWNQNDYCSVCGFDGRA